MFRSATLAGLLLVLALPPGSALAQDETPLDTYCLRVKVPAGTPVEASTILDDPSLLRVVYLAECSPIAEAVTSDPVPLGTPVVVSDGNVDWKLTVENVNDDAWKVIRKANRSNQPPGRGNRYVLVTLRRGHDVRGETHNPRLSVALWAGDEMYEGPALILPDALMNRHIIQGIPAGRYPKYGLAFPVPKTVGVEELRLIVTGAGEYAEMALVPEGELPDPAS